MKLVLTDSIREKEFDRHSDVFDIDVLKKAAKKSLQGLGKTIKSQSKLQKSVLRKISLTSSSGAGRSLFLIATNKNEAVLVMVRHKNDKEIGENMSVKNSKFNKALSKNLDLIFKDLKSGRFEKVNL